MSADITTSSSSFQEILGGSSSSEVISSNDASSVIEKEPLGSAANEEKHEDDMDEAELRAKYLKRNAVTSKDVDLIMASRQKKWSIEVPVTPVEHAALRFSLLSHR